MPDVIVVVLLCDYCSCTFVIHFLFSLSLSLSVCVCVCVCLCLCIELDGTRRAWVRKQKKKKVVGSGVDVR